MTHRLEGRQGQVPVVKRRLVFLKGEIPGLIAVGPRRPFQGDGQTLLQQGGESGIGRVERAGMVVGDQVMKGPGVLGQGPAPVGGGRHRPVPGRSPACGADKDGDEGRRDEP